MTAKATPPSMLNCMSMLMPVQDALAVLSGRWKIPIIIALSFGNRRFKEITREVPGITDKVLSKELKELEANKLISRTVYDAFPPVVEYAITAHGRSVRDIVSELHRWGTKHRKVVLGK